jgi:protein SCO1
MKARSAANPLLHRILWALLVAIVFGMIFIYFRQAWKFSRGVPTVLPTYEQVPPFTLTERSGRTVTREDLLGKVWIANFIFTTCPGPCSQMSAHMQELQQAFAKSKQVQLVSFSIDPTADTPEILRAYADRFLAKPDRWWFLTGGTEEGMHAFAQKVFWVAVAANPAGEVARFGKFVHGTRFALVDRTGVVRGHYDSFGREFIPHLLRDAGSLMKEEMR